MEEDDCDSLVSNLFSRNIQSHCEKIFNVFILNVYQLFILKSGKKRVLQFRLIPMNIIIDRNPALAFYQFLPICYLNEVPKQKSIIRFVKDRRLVIISYG